MNPMNAEASNTEMLSYMKHLQLVNCLFTIVEFEDETYQVVFRKNRIKISLDADNYKVVTLENQRTAYEATIQDGFALIEETVGSIDHRPHFHVDWADEMSLPTLHFQRPPVRITRTYEKGQAIELGFECVKRYHVIYQDGVEAHFDQRANNGYAFSFSTGFYGSFHKDPDDSYTLNFKGDRLKRGENDWNAQSKFIISRSKYTGNLLLILQDHATVDLK